MARRFSPLRNLDIAGAVLLFLALATTGCRSVRAPEVPNGPHVAVLTYNINWGAPNPELAAEIIRRANADIVCLQETTPAWEAFLRQALAGQYPWMEFRSSKGRAGGGLGFLAKSPGEEVAYIPSDTGWFDGWIQAFAVGPLKLQVLNVHLRPPVNDEGRFGLRGYLGTGDDRQVEVERFYAHRKSGLSLVVTGDFNDTAGSRAVRWLEHQGMVNALPQFDRHTPTWHWRMGFLTLKRRMDHIVYSTNLHCYSAKVIQSGASDHFPITAVLGQDKHIASSTFPMENAPSR